jgi:peptidoglycan/LPS O-acetylase OafA/YrhL
VWPALIAAVFALSRRQRTRCALDVSSRSHDIWLRRCAAAILLLTAASFVWSVVDTDSSPQPAYFSTLTRAWELGVGALLALAVAEVKGIPVRVRAIATWVGLAAILWAGVRYGDSTPFPGYHAALPVLGSALVLGGGIGAPAGGVAFLLDRRPMRFVGDISYSVYLWHWPLLILPAAYLGRPLAAYESLLVLVCAIGLAWLSYRWVEGPLRQGGTVPHKNSRALAMWPTATAAVMVAVVGLGAYAAPSTAAPAPPRDEAPAQLMASVKQAAASARAGAGLPDALTPTLTDLFGDITEPAPGCSASTAAQCFLGDATSTHTIAAWGDSHVGMWMRPLAELAAVKHYRIILFGKASCIPVDQQLFYKGKAYPQCDQFRSWALGQIRALKPERIIISGYVAQDFMDTSTGKRIPSMTGDTVSSKGSTLFRQAAERTLKQLVAIAPDVSVISDVTVLKESASTCLGSRTATRATCSVPLNIVVTDRNASWRAAAAAVGAHYVDVIPYLCDGQICPIVVGSTIVYRDQTHVTETYARALKPILARQLRLS